MTESADGPKTFSEALKSLLAHDCIRFSRIVETGQYALIFAFLAFWVGIGIDGFCRLLYPVKDKDTSIKTAGQFVQTFLVMMLQVCLSAISVFYIRKIGQLFPLFLNLCPSRYIPGHNVPERVGEIALALVFVGSMGTLLMELDKMRTFITKEPG